VNRDDVINYLKELEQVLNTEAQSQETFGKALDQLDLSSGTCFRTQRALTNHAEKVRYLRIRLVDLLFKER